MAPIRQVSWVLWDGSEMNCCLLSGRCLQPELNQLSALAQGTKGAVCSLVRQCWDLHVPMAFYMEQTCQEQVCQTSICSAF